MPISIANNIISSDPGNGFLDDSLREKNIKPHQVQESLLSLPDLVFEALYGGAAYGGKSWILTLLPLFRGFYKFRGYKGIILRNKFPDLEREIIRLSKEYYPKTGAKYNEQKHSWEWPEFNSYQDFGHVMFSIALILLCMTLRNIIIVHLTNLHISTPIHIITWLALVFVQVLVLILLLLGTEAILEELGKPLYMIGSFDPVKKVTE